MLALSLSDKFCCFGIFVFNRFLFSRFSFHQVFVLVLVFINEFVIFSFFTIFVFVNENHTDMRASYPNSCGSHTSCVINKIAITWSFHYITSTTLKSNYRLTAASRQHIHIELCEHIYSRSNITQHDNINSALTYNLATTQMSYTCTECSELWLPSQRRSH